MKQQQQGKTEPLQQKKKGWGGRKRSWLRQEQGLGGAGPEGASEGGGSGLWDPSRLPEAWMWGGNAGCIPFWYSDPPRGLSLSPLIPSPWMGPSECGTPSSPPATPQGHQSPPTSTCPPLSLPHHVLPGCMGVPPIPLGVQGPPPVPGRCLICEETWTLHPPILLSWLCPPYFLFFFFSFSLGFCFTLLLILFYFYFSNKSFIFLILSYSLYFVIVLLLLACSPHPPFIFSVVVLFYLVGVVSIIFLFFLIYFLSF